MKKAQLSIYLDREIFASLEAYATRQGKPKSLVAEAAIASFLSPDDSDRREAAIAKRLDRIVRVLERLERNDGITLETSQSSRALQPVPKAQNVTIALSKRSADGSLADRRFLRK